MKVGSKYDKTLKDKRRFSHLLNEDEYDYALELKPDEDYR